MNNETWKTVLRNDQYEVSNLGRVRRSGKRVLKQKLINTGYATVNLSRKCVVSTVTVHRLVCTAFHGIPDVGMVVNHKDGDKQNNSSDNLEWTTPAGNAQHSLENGFRKSPDQRGPANPRAKLTLVEAQEILDNTGRLTGVELAKKFSVTPQTVSDIRRRQTWQYL